MRDGITERERSVIRSIINELSAMFGCSPSEFRVRSDGRTRHIQRRVRRGSHPFHRWNEWLRCVMFRTEGGNLWLGFHVIEEGVPDPADRSKLEKYIRQEGVRYGLFQQPSKVQQQSASGN